MPLEFRFIVFHPREATTALHLFSRKNGRKIPAGTPVSAEPTAEDPPEGILWIEDEAGTRVKTKLPAGDVTAALILYCLTKKIPLPQDSEKVVEYMKRDGDMLFALRIGIYPEHQEKRS